MVINLADIGIEGVSGMLSIFPSSDHSMSQDSLSSIDRYFKIKNNDKNPYMLSYSISLYDFQIQQDVASVQKNQNIFS